MSKKREVAHNSIIQFGSKAISTALGLVAVMIMTRYLGQEKFGWYTTTISFLQFIGIFIDFGLTPVTSQFLNEKEHDNERIFKNLLGFRLTSAIIFFGLAPIIALFFPYPTPVKIAIGLTTIHFIAVSLRQVLTGFYQTKLKMYIHALGELLGRVILVGGVWLLAYMGSSFLPFMAIVILGSVAYCGFLFVYAAKEHFAGFKFEWKIWKKIIKKMWPIALSIMFNVVYLKGDIVLLSLFRPQETVGVYGAAYKVIDILTESAMMTMGLLLPLLTYSWSRGLKEQFKKRFQQSFDFMMALGTPAVVGTIMLARPIMDFIAGEKFIESALPLQILSLAVFGVFLGAVFGHTAVAIDKQKKTLWVYIGDAILTLIGYLIFVPTYGILGAAWMSVFSELFAGIFLYFTIKKYVQTKLNFTTFGKILFSSFAMAAILYLLPSWHVLILVPIGVVSYGAILLATGGITVSTIQEIISNRTNKTT